MKKISNLVMGYAMCAALWSCSSDNAPEQPGKPVFEGDGYIAVQIRLPQTPSTRANDVFDDGESYEYQVNTCDLILFKGKKGESESNAEVIGEFQLSNSFSPNTPNTDNITSSSIEVAQVSGLSLNEDDILYGLVLINTPEEIESTLTTLTDNTSTPTPKFSDWLKAASSEKFYKSTSDGYSNFFMTNAVLANKPGGGSEPTGDDFKVFTLTDLTPSLYATEDLAKANPSGCIYVERAVAKVTANSSIKDNTITIGEQQYTVDIQFAIDNTEPSSFIIRNAPQTGDNFAWNFFNSLVSNNNNKYRMVGSAGMPTLSAPYHTETPNIYRTYWCEDPNYEHDLHTTPTQGYIDRPTLTFKDIKTGDKLNPLYCHENTFTVDKQTQENTTRVVFKVTLTKKDATDPVTFYIINDDLTPYTQGDAESHANKEVLASAAIKTALTDALKSEVTEISDTDMSGFINISYNTNEDGIHEITGISLNTGATNFKNYFDDDSAGKFSGGDNANALQAVIDAVNNKYVIKEYKDGVCYYSELIRHFDDDGCPLPGDWIGTNVDQVYKADAKEYLGRYGVVRNNWYDLNIRSIKGFGDPVIPELKIDLSDDNKVDKKYMSVEIHTLSWAKRTHNYDL